jgi:hypothetical protein
LYRTVTSQTLLQRRAGSHLSRNIQGMENTGMEPGKPERLATQVSSGLYALYLKTPITLTITEPLPKRGRNISKITLFY